MKMMMKDGDENALKHFLGLLENKRKNPRVLSMMAFPCESLFLLHFFFLVESRSCRHHRRLTKENFNFATEHMNRIYTINTLCKFITLILLFRNEAFSKKTFIFRKSLEMNSHSKLLLRVD